MRETGLIENRGENVAAPGADTFVDVHVGDDLEDTGAGQPVEARVTPAAV